MKQQPPTVAIETPEWLSQMEASILPARHNGATAELSISGSQVLVVLTIIFCLVGPVTWTLVKYWLFAL